MQFTTAIGQRYGDTTVNQPAIAGAPKYLGLSNAFGRAPTTCGGIAYLPGRAAVSQLADATIAKELGHKLRPSARRPGRPAAGALAKCDRGAQRLRMSGGGLDRAYPSTPVIYAPDAKYSTGPASPAGPTFDFMSYAFPQWVSPKPLERPDRPLRPARKPDRRTR